MRPCIPILAVVAAGMAVGCDSVEVAGVPSPDAGSDDASQGGPPPNGTYRCDGEHAQQLDVASGQWVDDPGGCAIRGGTGSVLHWSGGTLGNGSAVLPGEGMPDKHRIVAGARNDAWWLSRRSVDSTEHAMLFHWDGTWWTELYDWDKFLPAGIVRDAAGGAWVYGQRQVFSDLGSFVLVPSVLHVPPTRDRWDEAWLFGSTDPEKGSSGLIVDMHATRDGAIWAVGQRPITGYGVILRKTGVAWEETPYSDGVPSSIWAESASDAWVTTSGVGVFHWDGVAWSNTWSVRYGTPPGRAAGFGWLTNGYHWDGVSWVQPDASFSGGFDAAYVLPHAVGVGRPFPPEVLGIFALDDRATLTSHSELWSYDGARWKKETSPLATGIETARGVLTSVAGDSADLWIAPIWTYAP